MFAIDTSSLVAYLAGEKGRDIEAVDIAFRDGTAILPPPVIAEILSDPKLPVKLEKIILSLPSTEPKEGFWLRVAKTRKKVLTKKRRARLADALIAQICIDYGFVLISRDSDFKAFEQYADLRLY